MESRSSRKYYNNNVDKSINRKINRLKHDQYDELIFVRIPKGLQFELLSNMPPMAISYGVIISMPNV